MKPINTLQARLERIALVRGMGRGIINEEKKPQEFQWPTKAASFKRKNTMSTDLEEVKETMTHQEIQTAAS